MLDYLATALVAITAWECARNAWRAARPVPEAAPTALALVPPDEVAEGRADAAALIGDVVAPLLANGQSAGLIAFAFAHRKKAEIRHLTAAQQDWLHGLSSEQLDTLAKCLPSLIDRHLARRTQIRGLPHVPLPQPIVTLRDVVERSGGGGLKSRSPGRR